MGYNKGLLIYKRPFPRVISSGGQKLAVIEASWSDVPTLFSVWLAAIVDVRHSNYSH